MRTDIELIRIIAAFGIVWFHSGVPVFRETAYAGLIVFLVFSAYFAIASSKNHTIMHRVKRIIIPCLVWSVIYAGVKLSLGWEVYKEDNGLLSRVLATPSIHLWFLPFLFFCLVGIDTLKSRVSKSAMAALSVLTASAILMSAPIWRELDFISPFGQYTHALPAVFIGIFFGCFAELNKQHKVILTSIMATAIVATYFMNLDGVSVTYLVGFALSLILVRGVSLIKHNDIIIKISGLTFGIYLVHVLVIYVLQYLHIVGVALPVLSFLISAAGVYLASAVIPRGIYRLAF